MDTNFWHPFADMAQVSTATVELTHGKGVHLWDRAGKEYIDSSSALWFCNVGHGRAELAEAAARQMRDLACYSTFGEMTNSNAEELARRVCAMSPIGPRGAAFFTSGGSDAIDTAGKLARRYWIERGEPQRRTFIARTGAYHGVNGFGTSLGGIDANRNGYGPLVEDVVHVPYDDADALKAAVHAAGDTLAAVIGELVLGAGGVRIAPQGYWAEVAPFVQSTGALLVVDEVITGFGRLGHPFASERFGISPDMIVSAKGITSGYLPLGVVVAAGKVRDVLWDAKVGLLRHGFTYSGHATACAVGLANLDIIERERLCERVREHEGAFTSALESLATHELIKEARSIGYMGALEFADDAIAQRPTLVEEFVAAARRHGVLTRNLLGRAAQVSPPLISGPEEFAAITKGFAAALDDLAA